VFVVPVAASTHASSAAPQDQSAPDTQRRPSMILGGTKRPSGAWRVSELEQLDAELGDAEERLKALETAQDSTSGGE
jgi:hypothetical protein